MRRIETIFRLLYSLVLETCSSCGTKYVIMNRHYDASKLINLVIAFESEVAEFTIENHCANIPTPIEITGTPGGLFD